jgi:hypothetical protein
VNGRHFSCGINKISGWQAVGAIGLPSTYFVNAAGEVTAVHRGALTQVQLQSYLKDTIQ